MATIRDVAKLCGVSPMTVSFVLNNKPGQVSEETRIRVLKAMRDLDYRPTAMRKAEEREILTLGLAAGAEGHTLLQTGYYASIAAGILLAIDTLQHNLTLFTHSLLHSDTHRSLRVYCDGRCDGMMVTAPLCNSPLVLALQERGFPFVLIGDPGDSEAVSYVDIDNITAGFQATEVLIHQGHRRIAHLKGPDFVHSALNRAEGYCCALRQYGLPPDPSIALGYARNKQQTIERLSQIFDRPREELPTALFCWNDGTVGMAYQAIQARGLRIPDDVSVIGFDDDACIAQLDPPLTTFRQPYNAISRRAVDMLIAQIRGQTNTPQREFLPFELIWRDSVAPPQE